MKNNIKKSFLYPPLKNIFLYVFFLINIAMQNLKTKYIRERKQLTNKKKKKERKQT